MRNRVALGSSRQAETMPFASLRWSGRSAHAEATRDGARVPPVPTILAPGINYMLAASDWNQHLEWDLQPFTKYNPLQLLVCHDRSTRVPHGFF